MQQNIELWIKIWDVIEWIRMSCVSCGIERNGIECFKWNWCFDWNFNLRIDILLN